MNNALNELYNEMLTKNWNIESILNKFNAMSQTLRFKERNMYQVQKLMVNRTHIEELIEKIGKRLSDLGVTLKAFSELEVTISNYYEEV